MHAVRRRPYQEYYLGMSYLLRPDEERFLMHMLDIDLQKQEGYNTNFTRAEYMRRMGLREYTFDRCARTLCILGLIVKRADSNRNRVRYDLNRDVYFKLVRIVSLTRKHERLQSFFDFHVKQLGKTIADLSEEDIRGLIV